MVKTPNEDIRNRIIELLSKEPNLYINQIKRKLDLKNSGRTWYHINILKERGKVALIPTIEERGKAIIVRVRLK